MHTSLMSRLGRSRREGGFTMIELLVVVIIIAILAAIAVPVYIGVQNNAKKRAIDSDVHTTVTNVGAVLAEDGSLPPGTYTSAPIDTSGGSGSGSGLSSTTKAGDANIQNSHSPSDESVTVTVTPPPAAGGNPTVHVIGKAPSVDYIVDTEVGGKTTVTTVAGSASGSGSTGGGSGTGTTPTAPASSGFKLCQANSSTACVQISTTATQMAVYSSTYGGAPKMGYQVTQLGNFGLSQNSSVPSQALAFTRSDVNTQVYGTAVYSAAYLNSFGSYSTPVPDGTYWVQLDAPYMDKATCFTLNNGYGGYGCDAATGQPTTTDGTASARS